MMNPKRRGAALMMVMVILSLLLVLAVSFTFLMSQQQGTSVASLGGEQTRIITRTGADHAYARLNYRNRLNEFDRWADLIPSDVTNEDNPFLDSYDESIVDLLADLEGWGDQPPLFGGLLDSNGNPTFRVEDPKKRVLGMNIQDETGKVNLNFSTVAMVGNMLGSSTVQANASATGGVYEQIVLEDASFLDPYDDIGDDDIRGGGFVVIDNVLFKYQMRSGNVLLSCVPNPTYSSVNALFAWGSPGREIQTGEYATTPTAYKIAYWSWMRSVDGSSPAVFNSIGDVRRIANLDRWFAPDYAVAPIVMGQRMDGWPEGLDPVSYQWLDENATTISPTEHYDGGWCYPHVVVLGDMQAMGESGKMVLQLQYDDQIGVQQDYYAPRDPRRPNPNNNQAQWAGIGRGNLVRLRRLDGPGDSFLGMVLGGYPGRAGNGNQPAVYGGLTIACEGDRTINANEAWVIEVAERASININTANIDTLAAVFHGVGPRGQANLPISRAQSYEIALAILERTRGDEPFTDLDELVTFLTNLSQQQPAPITSQQLAIFANQQRYPYAMRNSGAVTAQFRFDSLDTYMVDAFATRYQPSGGTMARDAFREWVQIGSDVDRTYSWFTYAQLQREMELPQGNIMQLHPAGTFMVNNQLEQRMKGLVELPYLHYLADERLVRAWRGMSTNPGPPQPWTQRVAQNVNNLAQNTVRPEKFYSNVGQVQPQGSSATFEGGNLEAGMFSFWYRPHWTDHTANHYIFDTAEQEYSNRMSLLWWGDRKGAHRLSGNDSGLVFRVKDRTLQEAYTELRYELEPGHFRSGDWYNMALNWKGTELSHISLLLDGDAKSTAGGTAIQPVVNHTFRQPNGAWFTMTTTLQNDLEDPSIGGAITIDLQVDPLDIDGLPPRGVVVIGDEAIEYNGNNGYALLNIRRGSRGTPASFHPDGSKVTVFGYTDGLRAYNANNNNIDVPRFPNLPQTQGLLTGDLGVRTFYRVNKDGTNQPGYFRPTELGPDAGFPGAGDDARGGDPFHLPLDDYAGLPDRGIVAVIGLAWNDYMPAGQTPGVPASEQYPNWNDDGDSSTPPAGLGAYPVPRNVRDPMVVPPPNLNANPQILRLANLKMEYVAYDGIGGSGLNVIARYDQDFNYKAPNTWWHFLGAYTDLMTPQPGNQVDANIISFLSLGSVVMPLSIDVDSSLGYHPRSIVQVDNEWFFYNHLWNPDAGISNPGATPTGTDDNLFPNLSYLDFSRLTIFARHCIVNDNKNAPPFSPWRGAMGTGVSGHTAAARVVPTFGTTVRTGETDIITLVRDVNADKEQHQIVRHKPLTDMQIDWITFNASFSLGGVLSSPSAGNGNQYICALDDHTRANFPANNANRWDRNTNLCKFPTGELPVELPTQWSFASGDPRTIDGGSQGLSLVNSADFDAFEFRMYNKGNFRLISPMTDSTPGNAQDLQVNTPLPPNMSVVHIDNELIAYRGTEVRQIQVTNPQTGQTSTIDTYWLLDITRGILGSPIEAHAGGTPIMNMASMRVGRPNASGTARTSFIQTTMGAETFRPYGFIRIEEETGQTEIIGYQRYQELQLPDPNNPSVLVRTGNVNCGVYNNPDDSQALFRGAYGTRAMGYSNRALMFDQPVRFPDWFPNYRRTLTRNNTTRDEPFHTAPTEGIPGAESPEISYFQGSAAFRNSVYKDFRWRIQYTPLADMSRHSNAIGARLVMRFKHPGRPMANWGSIPTNRIGGLYSFEFDPGAYNCEEVPSGITLWEQTEDLTGFPDAPGGIRAERIEWRVYFYFKRGAFDDENYKTTLQFQGASMTLNQLTRVVRHEEKR